jgi:hypothetical protein
VKTRVDVRLLAEARRFAFRFACDDCAHFAVHRAQEAAVALAPADACSLGYPAAPRPDALAGADLELCKSFELA